MNNSDMIKDEIISLVASGEMNPVSLACSKFNISRQAAAGHIKKLIQNKQLCSTGATRNKVYSLGPIRCKQLNLDLSKKIDEHLVFLNEFAWITNDLPENIQSIVFYGFTEMVNNVIDHSDGTSCIIFIKRHMDRINCIIIDDGEGIFRRISRLCELSDERQSILELSKGKLTTDPDNHSGQGIFFTSRMFDDFIIESKGLRFDHHSKQQYDSIQDDACVSKIGERATVVFMSISLSSDRVDKDIFDEYSAPEEENYAFNKTVVPVKLAKYGNEQLVSRSQAKRVLSGLDKFKNIIFDFDGVDMIGQAFADQIFRVFKNANPRLVIVSQNTNSRIDSMINRTADTI